MSRGMSSSASRDTQVKRARLYPEVTRLPLEDANICVNCDTIHNGDVCPVCASTHLMPLASIIGRLPQNRCFEKEFTPAIVQVPEVLVACNLRQLNPVPATGQ